MTLTAMWIGALILLPAAGLVTWAILGMVRVEEELRSFSAMEAMDFEIGSQAAKDSERARWPIPG